MYHDFSYPAVLTSSRRAAWQIEDVLPEGARLDFTRPFLPEALARTADLPGLMGTEPLTLNHIRGHEYLSLFGLVEEFILPFVLDHVRADLGGGDERIRALLQFASEEAKHIHLFKRFHAAFTAGFGTCCDVIGPPEAIAREVLRHSPLGVALLILHIEWMTQRHYLESVRGNEALDPLFASLLRHHWMEEAQHAKLDTLMVEALAAEKTDAEIAAAVGDYLEMVAFFDGGLKAQTGFNLAALETATGRMLDDGVKEDLLHRQHQALRWTYLGSGMTHPNFTATLSRLSPAMRERVDAAAQAFC